MYINPPYPQAQEEVVIILVLVSPVPLSRVTKVSWWSWLTFQWFIPWSELLVVKHSKCTWWEATVTCAQCEPRKHGPSWKCGSGSSMSTCATHRGLLDLLVVLAESKLTWLVFLDPNGQGPGSVWLICHLSLIYILQIHDQPWTGLLRNAPMKCVLFVTVSQNGSLIWWASPRTWEDF